VRARLIAAVATLTLAAAAAPAQGATGAEVAARLSAERQAHGIPGGITEDPVWSARCEKHVRWMALNGRVEHAEDPGTPGYSRDGDLAGQNSVLSSGTIDFNRVNPYLTAPYHLLQLYAPELLTIGAFENGKYGCHTTFPGYTRPAPAADTFYSYPGDGARIPWFEEARENPSVPGDEVGLPQGTITGPDMQVYWRGPDDAVPLSDLVAATLTDDSGTAIDARTVGNQQNGLALPGSGFVIPVRPLKPATSYGATATFSSGDPANPRTLTHSWSFRTTSLPSPKSAVKMKLVSRSRKRLNFILIGNDVYAGRPAKVTLDYGPGSRKTVLKPPLGSTVQASAPPKGLTLKVTLTVKPFSVGGVRVPGANVVKRFGA
jgi:hypothetical protein